MSILATDFMRDGHGDLLIRDGDFMVDASETQHISDLLLASPGAYKQSPLLGISLYRELNGGGSAANLNEIRKRLILNAQMDGMTVTKLKLNGLTDFEIDGTR